MNAAVAAKLARMPQLVETDRLAEVCLLLGELVDPDLDPVAYLGRLDRMAAEVVGTSHLSLRRVISIKEGIGGNTDNYDSVDNGFLHRVLDSRRGWPILVSVIWIEVGRRAGIKVEGVGLPGHFLVYAAGQLVDPFHFGEAIGRDEAARLVAESLGGVPRVDPSWLVAVDTHTIIKRVLLNLRGRYHDLGDETNLEWVTGAENTLA